MDWHVHVGWTADLTEPHEDTADTLLIDLAEQSVGAVTFPDPELDRWGIGFSVEAGTMRQAAELALRLHAAAATAAGMRRVNVLALDIIDPAGMDARLQRPDIPPLVGFAGIAEMAGVSRQRAREIAERPDFPQRIPDSPDPMFVRSQVERYLEKPRRPGRPRKDATA